MSFSITNKLFPSNHKTVFVLDHTPYFGISCESPIELEFLKARTPGFIPMTPICKSLWTSSVESAIEYCRIVWDLFPQGKLVRFIASDTVAHILNTWSPSQQNLSHVMNAMSLIGVPPPHAINRNLEYTVLHGLRAAIEALSDCTDIQVKKSQNQTFGDVQTKLINRCRVICITSARDNDSMKRLEEIFLSVLQQQNKVAAGSDRLLTIDHCHLVIINTFPVNIESQVNNHPPKNLSTILTTEVHSIKAPLISNKLSTLILEHYNLASTTVTGIPMKEEQNASSSANYDVEIYHASSAHTAILKGNALDSAAIRTIKDGLEYETVTLKWCTPRGCSGSELQNCTGMFRITPVDVNSRPSLCLINFLLNGRSVMLEMPRKAGGKITSHLLASHGGEIFIHTLCTARSVLEDPPSISEGCGGRVTDYRITDFGLLIKQNTLVPIKAGFVDEGNRPIQKMKTRLNRHTKYWPLTISSTLIFNLKGYIDPLPSIITKEKITEEEVYQCRRIIFNLISLESKNESLYSLNAGQRVKGQKREDQYKAMWNELETLLKKNLHTADHRSVYNCLLECHKFNFEEEKLSDKVELDEALRELDHIGPSKSDSDAPRASVIRATTDSPMSPPPLTSINPPVAKSGTSRSGGIYSAPRTLLDIFTSQEKVKSRPEFSGRLAGGAVAKLYANHKYADSGSRGESMEVE
ncbi:protein asunder [Tribolium castaneum]|uniref:Protein asunder n=1 Tax=Tribolium castaneum TaxID=7070 RepID=D6WX84_TRICA|nr:PREDICTED: protein asunder [Tribolium castaneum]EFA08805.1 Protein asunder-like Protein [Tribolium castaneum]|eukprot:XP_973208.1 PREDICTED: protein asunder [Tribolium castaneum]